MYNDPQGLSREEVNHRFLNTLTSLHALLRHDFVGFEDQQVRDAVATFEAQLLAFVSIQRSLQGDPAAAVLDVPAHFGKLCGQLAAVLLTPRGVDLEFFSDEGEMDSETAEKLGLIVVELVTNAAKHAFLGRGWGRVSVTLRRSDGSWRCSVGDNGVGLRAGRGGSGLRLIEGLARSIGAGLTTHSDEAGLQVIVKPGAPLTILPTT